MVAITVARRKIGFGVDFLRRHSACSVAHLLTDVIAAGAGGESLELRVQVDRGLPLSHSGIFE